jgi:hypothetical protein
MSVWGIKKPALGGLEVEEDWRPRARKIGKAVKLWPVRRQNGSMAHLPLMNAAFGHFVNDLPRNVLWPLR